MKPHSALAGGRILRDVSSSPVPPESSRELTSAEQSLARIETALVEQADAAGGGQGDDGLGVGLDVLRGLADQELSRAESARSRARQAFILASGFFAVVQTVSFGTFVTTAAKAGGRTGLLINHATLAVAAVAVCGLCMLIADRAFGAHDLEPETILDYLEGDVTRHDVSRRFVRLYATITVSRRRANARRSWFVLATQVFSLVAIGLTIWELLIGLHPGF